MDYSDFLDFIKTEVQSHMGEGYTISATHVKKNNGILLDGITIAGKGQRIFPAFYLNGCYRDYQEGKSTAEIVEEIIGAYHADGLRPEIDLDFFKSYQEMKDRVLFKLVHYHKNRELLKEIPHIRFLDLAILFYCKITNRLLENGTILITNSHLAIWQVTTEELYQDAMRNTPADSPAVIQTMEEVVKGIYEHELQEKWGADAEVSQFIDRMFDEEQQKVTVSKPDRVEGGRMMYVLSNPKKLFGAAAMLYPQVVARFAERIAADLYLLPSSVHEIIMIPDDGLQDKDELLRMVSEINDTQVDPEEVLAYAVYHFNRRDSEILLLT